MFLNIYNYVSKVAFLKSSHILFIQINLSNCIIVRSLSYCKHSDCSTSWYVSIINILVINMVFASTYTYFYAYTCLLYRKHIMYIHVYALQCTTIQCKSYKTCFLLRASKGDDLQCIHDRFQLNTVFK